MTQLQLLRGTGLPAGSGLARILVILQPHVSWLAPVLCGMALALVSSGVTLAADHGAGAPEPHAAPAKNAAASGPVAKSTGEQLQEAIVSGNPANKRVALVVSGKEKKYITIPAKEPLAPAEVPERAAGKVPAVAHRATHAVPTGAPINPKASREYIRARAAAITGHETGFAAPATASHGNHEGEVHWSYEGATGPQAWGQLKPEFSLCGVGQRQSPINIEESGTLQGPAEPLLFNYQSSTGSVVNNGHTIQVDLYGDNNLTVRGSVYKLVQFHFHTPSEEQVNYRNFAMVAHLVHKNAENQLAVVSVLLDPGVANPLINKVWTYMPLDMNDRVRLPVGLIDMNELLPKDQRYYQFMGSLTTPPCTEGVLWMVFKQPTPVSREQIKLFSQLFPNNARPVQPINGRAVRNAQ